MCSLLVDHEPTPTYQGVMFKLGCVALVVAAATNSRADTAASPVAAATSGEPAALRPVLSTHGWAVDVTGYVQADAVVYAQGSVDETDPGTGAPLNQTHFGIPRASLRADARRGPFSGELELEAFTTRATLPRVTQTSGVRLEIATARWHERELVEVVGGLFRIPFGAQTPTSPRGRDFLELPTMNRALLPGDIDAGVMVRGALGLARWSVAVMNGAPVGDAQWKGADPSSSYDVVGRVGADVPLPMRARVVGGISALTGSALSPGAPPTKDKLVWVDEDGNGQVSPSEIQVVPGTPGEPSQPFDHRALGADLQVSWCLCALGTGYAFFEGAIATNLDRGLVFADPIRRSRDIRELGFALGVVQHVGDNALVGVRFDRYDADRDAHEVQGAANVGNQQRFQTVSVMASGLWSGMRLMGQYDHATNPFGRDDSGAIVSRRDDRITVRAQVGF